MIEEAENDYIIDVITKRITNDSKLSKSYIEGCTQRRYSFTDILKHIILVLRLNLTWRNVVKLTKSKMSYGIIYHTYTKLLKDNIINDCFNETVNMYIRENPENKLDIRMTDTSSIINKYGKENVGRNKYYNNKRVTKISLIADKLGTPLDVKIYSGNMYDSKILENHIDEKSVMNNDIDVKYRNIMLADKGYDSTQVRKILEDKGYKNSIIDYNKRNTKDQKKIKKLTREERIIYNMRVRIEQTFMKLKRYRRVDERYDRKLNTYEGFVKMGLMKIISENK